MQPTLENFRALFEEFASVADAKVQLFLDEAIEKMNSDECYGTATLYRTAHELALNLQATDSDNVSGAGALTSASADGLSVGFAQVDWANSVEGSYWSKTPYGQKYMQLIYECSGGSRVVGGCLC
jgi:uncharacterized metal-binding protein